MSKRMVGSQRYPPRQICGPLWEKFGHPCFNTTQEKKAKYEFALNNIKINFLILNLNFVSQTQ